MSCSKLEWCRWRRCWYASKWIVKWMVASADTNFNVILVSCIDSWNLQTNHSVRWLAWPSIILWNNKLVCCCKDGRSLNVCSIWRMKYSWLFILLRCLPMQVLGRECVCSLQAPIVKLNQSVLARLVGRQSKIDAVISTVELQSN